MAILELLSSEQKRQHSKPATTGGQSMLGAIRNIKLSTRAHNGRLGPGSPNQRVDINNTKLVLGTKWLPTHHPFIKLAFQLDPNTWKAVGMQ